jgi:hypothetical protein
VFETLGGHWPHGRWLSSVHHAASLCLAGGGHLDELRNELTAEWHNPRGPWILVVADRAEDFLKVCRVESERAWVGRMLRSISDHSIYSELLEEYKKEGAILEARRKRVRNALVHGNPAHFEVVTSVRAYAEFLSSSALHAGIDSYVTSRSPANALAENTAEYTAMQAGIDCATYWRSQIAVTPET